jgi:DNA-binding HxlR family transcriptional regulator
MTQRYALPCPIARTLDVIGERWTMLILRDLMLEGPRKFHELERAFRGASPNTLSARLKSLEEAGLITRRFYEQHPPRAEYLLTDKGETLRPVLAALRDWGMRRLPW